MTIAETISSRLTLDISEFNRGIVEAMAYMLRLSEAGANSSTMLENMNSVIGGVANMFTGVLLSSLGSTNVGFTNFASGVMRAMLGASSGIDLSVGSIVSKILSIGNAAPGAASGAEIIANAIRSPFQRLEGSAYGIMSNVGQGLINGLNAKKALIISTAKSIASVTVNSLKSVLRIASPSKVMRTIGEQTAQGFALGLGDMQSDITRRAGMMADAVTGQNFARSEVGGSGGEDMSALANRLDTLISLLSGGEQIMQVDGRAFARLVREYS